MITDTQIKIAAVAALEALEMMSKKAGVTPAEILEAVISDQGSNTANYFEGLVSSALRDVPAMLKASA